MRNVVLGSAVLLLCLLFSWWAGRVTRNFWSGGKGYSSANENCYNLPTDSQWPSAKSWAGLNSSTYGQLIKTVPAGHVCHDPDYDQHACAAVRQQWTMVDGRTSIPEAVYETSFAGDACDPFGPRSTRCDVGGYARYSINVTHPDDVSAGLKFAKRHNVRVVVKNTGHDYLGRSVAAGSLSFWMHNLKYMELVEDFRSPAYRGPAVKVGAGVEVLEVYDYLDKLGYMFVGGECSTVGVAGGFTAGGGQSPLSGYAGLSADQTLEFEVVLADGSLVTASRKENIDLFWALSGGGPGYGVIISATFKIYPEVQIVGSILSFANDHSDERSGSYWEAIQTWHSLVPAIVDMNAYAYTVITKNSFSMSPLFAPAQDQAAVLKLLAPLYDKLDKLGIPYRADTTSHRRFLEAWRKFYPIGNATTTPHFTSHFIDQEIVKSDMDSLQSTVHSITRDGGYILEMILNVNNTKAGKTDNAVNPDWRRSNMFILASSGDPSSRPGIPNNMVTNVWGGRLRSLSPDTGTYMNEADPDEPDFQKSFYGSNYDRLLEIKKKYDPNSMFYAKTGVGSDRWEVTSKSRLCQL